MLFGAVLIVCTGRFQLLLLFSMMDRAVSVSFRCMPWSAAVFGFPGTGSEQKDIRNSGLSPARSTTYGVTWILLTFYGLGSHTVAPPW